MTPLIQSAINVSEGRRPGVVEAVVQAARDTPGATVADYSADEDHNRMVVTLLAGPSAIVEAAVAVSRAAVQAIDLRAHTGAHPRLGAVDVIPLTPIRAISLEECVEVSREIGSRIGHELGLPVYYYETSAAPGRMASLPEIRAGGFEGLFGTLLEGDRLPDEGPAKPHPTAGAVVVGARPPLVAFNVDLRSGNIALARSIAGSIRRERRTRDFLMGVRALGLWLPRRGRAQVSMNITRPSATPLSPIFDYIGALASERGEEIWGSEIIGLVPRTSLGGESADRILWHTYREAQVVEYWVDRL